MTEEKKDNPPVKQDPRMPQPLGRKFSRRLPAGLDRITLMMGFMFFVGIIWVLGESRAISPQKANADSVDSAVMVKAGLLNMKLLTTESKDRDDAPGKIVATFFQDVKERQIPLADLKVNPFVTVGCEEYSGEKKIDQAKVKVEEIVSDKLPAEIVAPPVDKMLLQSVLTMGSNSSATISGVLVAEGHVIGGWMVVEIHPTKVVLQWREKKYVLEMSR